MKKIKSILIVLLEIIIIVYAISITTLLLMRNKFGYTEIGRTTLIHVNEDNINHFSGFEEGDLVILEKPKYSDVDVGDELYFYYVQNAKYTVKKGKVEEKMGDEDGYMYSIDSIKGVTISEEKIIGKYDGKTYHKIGFVLDILESTFGFLILVIMPILLIFIYQFYNLVMLIKTPKKSTSTKRKSSTSKKKASATKKKK